MGTPNSERIFPVLLPILLLFQIAPIISTSVTKSRDDTIVDKTIGRDVVESVIRKIHKSGLFKPDHSFLIRVAFTETRFGKNDSTFGSGGGIWSLDEPLFALTQKKELSQIHDQIKTKFGLTWRNVSWADLVKPLHSGLGTAIYLSSLPFEIPDKINLQAQFWITNFNRHSRSVEQFIRDSEELRNLTKCRGKMDLCIVLDSSGSIGGDNYRKALDFTASLISSFTLDHTRIGMLVYSNYVQDVFKLDNNRTIGELGQMANSARYISSGTRTDLGISRAVEFFEEAGSIEGVPQIMLVLTDGRSDSHQNTLSAVNVSRAAGVLPMSVGIGGDILDSELLDIALWDPQRVFKLSDFTALQDFLFTITEVACEVPQKTDVNTTYNDTLVKDERRRYEIELPSDGITVFMNVTSGAARGFWSKSEEAPSEAVHDGIIDGPTFIPGDGDEVLDVGFAIAAAFANSKAYVTIEGVEEYVSYTLKLEVGDLSGNSGGVPGGVPGLLIPFGILVQVLRRFE